MPQTILLVDDDPDILMPMSSVIKRRGFDVLEARTAEDALEMLKKKLPDLILTDVLLPKMNGYELVKQIKSSSFTCDIPILVITGRGQMKEVFDMVGISAFIAKPFSPDELLQKIQEVLSIKDAVKEKEAVQKKKILIVGRKEFAEVSNDIKDICEKFLCESIVVFSVADAAAQIVEFSPHAFIMDVQLDGKHAAELVNIIRHFPNYEESPIIGFCYYQVQSLEDPLLRDKILRIEEDAGKFLSTGANVYIERYARETMIEAIKEHILIHAKKVK